MDILDDLSPSYDAILEIAPPITPSTPSFKYTFLNDTFSYSVVRTEGHTIIYPDYPDHQNSFTPVIVRGHPSLTEIHDEYLELIEEGFEV